MSRPLTIPELTTLSMLAECVQAGQPITRVTAAGDTEWGIARAFTRDGGGFLTTDEDVRDGFVWISGGSGLFERWWPVKELVEGIRDGDVALNYRPDSNKPQCRLCPYVAHDGADYAEHYAANHRSKP